MKVIGFRCSNSDYTFCVISGKKSKPIIESTGTVSFPKGFNDAEISKWFFQELESTFKVNKPEIVCIKGAEPMVKRSSNLDKRLQVEGIIFLAAACFGTTKVFKKVKSTIAKDLGLKGRGKYLEQLDTSVIDNFDGLSDKVQETIMAGWSCM